MTARDTATRQGMQVIKVGINRLLCYVPLGYMPYALLIDRSDRIDRIDYPDRSRAIESWYQSIN
jgi:hypothetical protein